MRGREREGGEGGRRRKGEDGTTIVRSDKTSDYHYVFLLNLNYKLFTYCLTVIERESNFCS